MRSRSPTAPSRQHALPGFRRDHRSLGAAPRTPPEESCRSLRHPRRTVPHLGEGVRTPGKFRKFAEFRPGQADPGHHPVARGSRIQPARERHVATGLAAATAGAIGPTPAGRSVCTLSAGRPVLHEKQSACSALRLGRLPGTPAAMRQPVRLHRPRGNPPFQVAGYVRRRRCNGRQVEDRPTLGTKPPERQRCRSGGAHRVTRPY